MSVIGVWHVDFSRKPKAAHLHDFACHMTDASDSSEFDKFLEGLLKLIIENSVNDRVNERVKVAQPGEDVEHQWVKPAALCTDGRHQRPHKERQPAHNERSQDDAQSFCGFTLTGCAQALSLQDAISQLDFDTVDEERGAS